MTRQTDVTFVICVRNDGYLASLERLKVYRRVLDEDAAARGLVRIVDESDEEYLYPAEYFVPIALPEAAERAFTAA